jgi:hypothetical protein
VRAFNADTPGILYVGGAFTAAGGVAGADHIAAWDGTSWSALGTSAFTGDVNAIESVGGRVFAGGTFQNAGGDANADFLAVWDGSKWSSFCNANGPAFGGNVTSLQIIGSTLYVGGEYQNGAGIAAADYILACDLNTGAVSSPIASDGQGGAIYALTADSRGILYAAGPFINEGGVADADHVAAYDGSAWHALGTGASAGNGPVTGIARGIGSDGTNVFIGTDATDIAGIPQADHVARWDGTAWSAMGSDTAGSNGWFPTSTSINTITTSGSTVYAAGSFQNADGDPTADFIASFDGTAWHPVGSNGAGDGALNANTLAVSLFGGKLYAGGAFNKAGGDVLASSAASFDLNPGPVPLPAPTRGETVNAVPTKGTVLVKLPAGAARRSKDAWTRAAAAGFVPLQSLGRQIPVGSTLDTSKGTVRLLSAVDSAGKTQNGDFSQGLFNITQGRKNPLTTVSMTGGGLNACSKLPRGGSAKASAGAARKRSRSLFSSVKGRFQTRGRNSTATVRGTSYLVKDTCQGTLTKVKTGVVQVRDLRLRRTKTVKAGHSYLARAFKKKG